MPTPSLQDITAPEGICYGCGGSNPHGLHIKSRWDADGVHLIAEHHPEAKYSGWPDLVYGGLIAMLVDCHSNWTAMAYHYRAEQREPGSLARVEGDVGRKSRVVCEVYAGEVLTAIGDSLFVRVDTRELAAAAHGRDG
ncbi:thioesterase [Pseudomonas sp. S3E12]|uniref:thioesterase n=1 Tax=Pseudomonas sp. S3E12 TaxID=1873126 RepID=UPI00081C0721|nr:thioesterase [Pseudomonas sp. S3E12]OCW18976.1 thioesterase [Pseudomonas sp. S3E12]